MWYFLPKFHCELNLLNSVGGFSKGSITNTLSQLKSTNSSKMSSNSIRGEALFMGAASHRIPVCELDSQQRRHHGGRRQFQACRRQNGDFAKRSATWR